MLLAGVVASNRIAFPPGTGELAGALQAVSLDASATLTGHVGVLNAALASVALIATGVLPISGALAATLVAVDLDATGDLATAAGDAVLREGGDYLLREDGDHILRE